MNNKNRNKTKAITPKYDCAALYAAYLLVNPLVIGIEPKPDQWIIDLLEDCSAAPSKDDHG